MIHTDVLKETENASVGRGVNKFLASEQKPPRMKTKALGDVQNTLHSRFSNSVNSNAHSGVKPSFHSKPVATEKFPKCKTSVSGRTVNVTPTKSTKKFFLTTPTADSETFEIHNHVLCEQDHQFYVNDFLKEYKFSEEQINRLAYSVKSFVKPFSVKLFEPCEDIDIPCMEKCNESIFSVNDIFTDVIAPPVPAPTEML